MSVQQGSKGPDLSALKIDEEARSGGDRSTIWRIVAVAVFVVVLGLFGVVFLRGRTPVVELAAARPAGDGAAAGVPHARGDATPPMPRGAGPPHGRPSRWPGPACRCWRSTWPTPSASSLANRTSRRRAFPACRRWTWRGPPATG